MTARFDTKVLTATLMVRAADGAVAPLGERDLLASGKRVTYGKKAAWLYAIGIGGDLINIIEHVRDSTGHAMPLGAAHDPPIGSQL